jgi:tetratricopeptide (TPR) repeat protein
LDRLGREAGNDPSLTAELIAAYTKIGTVQGNPDRASLGDPAGALVSYGRALELLRSMPPGLEDDLATSHRLLVLHQQVAETYRGLGNATEAAAHFESARAIAALACRTSPQTAEPRRYYLDSSMHLAGVVGAEHGPAAAERVGEETVRFLDSLPDLDPQNTNEVFQMGMVHFQLGGLWQHAERPARAIEQYDRALPLTRQAATAVPDDIIVALGVADVLWYRGIARERMRDPDGAITDLELACSAMEQASALQPTLRGPHLAWSEILARLARLLVDANELDRAIDYSRASVQKLEQVHADFPASVTHVGTAVRGNTEHAELLLRIVRETEGTEHPRVWRLDLARESQRHWQRSLDLVNSIEQYETKASYSLDPQLIRDRVAEIDRLLAAVEAN